MKKKALNPLVYLFLFIAVDQAIKIVLWYKFPQLVNLNQGILFGFVTNIYLVGILLIIGSSILGYLIYRSKQIDIALILILSGAISNIVDRFVYKGVIDYIHISFWSDFNLADIYIVVGVIIYIYKLLFISRYKQSD